MKLRIQQRQSVLGKLTWLAREVDGKTEADGFKSIIEAEEWAAQQGHVIVDDEYEAFAAEETDRMRREIDPNPHEIR
jgi:hypothetical protein